MKTSNRVLFLTNYISKKELFTHLEISGNTLNNYLKNNKWKKYQIKEIDNIFEYVKNIMLDKSKEIIKIYFIDDILTCDIKINAIQQ